MQFMNGGLAKQKKKSIKFSIFENNPNQISSITFSNFYLFFFQLNQKKNPVNVCFENLPVINKKKHKSHIFIMKSINRKILSNNEENCKYVSHLDFIQDIEFKPDRKSMGSQTSSKANQSVKQHKQNKDGTEDYLASCQQCIKNQIR